MTVMYRGPTGATTGIQLNVGPLRTTQYWRSLGEYVEGGVLQEKHYIFPTTYPEGLCGDPCVELEKSRSLGVCSPHLTIGKVHDLIG